ncbi:hypothetical protein SKAU_G00090280 [Synaphobranchus kaupii]|uniref:Uncharacterized protein n=1 Tax=Synaphobranchus kaupii TaxID=118154 RepID=A0A9Q1J487_SYNKA|nr:hypothetical protein SKAU_G00090280 [Synaphobranchus kaupii]
MVARFVPGAMDLVPRGAEFGLLWRFSTGTGRMFLRALIQSLTKIRPLRYEGCRPQFASGKAEEEREETYVSRWANGQTSLSGRE